MSGKNLHATLPNSPLVWADSGDVRIEWRAFFVRLWDRTGGAVGTPPGGGSGTITGVIAGNGLGGGGTSGTVTLSLTIPVTIGDGGTGATTAAQALLNLGAVAKAGDTMTGTLTMPYGAVATPAIGIGGSDMGFWRAGANTLYLNAGPSTPAMAWQSGSTPTVASLLPLSMQNNQINNLATPTVSTDAATKGYVDSVSGPGVDVPDAPSDGTTYGRLNATWSGVLPLTGGSLSAAVTFTGVGLGSTDLSKHITLSTAGTGYGINYLSGTVGFIAGQAAGSFMWLIGGTATALLNSTVLQTVVPVQLPGDPTTNLQAATKQYVDSKAGSGGIPDAPSDGNTYGRLNAAWTGVLPISGGQLTGFLLTTMGTSGAPALMLGSNDTGFYRAGANLFLNVGAAANFAFTGVQNVSYQPLSLNNQKIVTLADATAPTDALNQRSGDARYMAAGAGPFLPLAGGTLTGTLVAPDITVSGFITQPNAPVLASQVANKSYVDSAPFLALTGGVLSGFLVLSNDPVTALEAATKQYVDLRAPLASPAFTGVPTAPTATALNNTTQIATTAYADNLNTFLWG